MNISKEEAIELADFVVELINQLRITTEVHKHHYNKATKKSRHEVIKGCYFDLSKTPLVGQCVKDGVLGYLGFEAEGE